jgi:hypothetical protein
MAATLWLGVSLEGLDVRLGSSLLCPLLLLAKGGKTLSVPRLD